MAPQVLFLELNEISFEYVERYCARGALPAFQRLLSQHPIVETVSESAYEQLEPWIQWVTAHTGLPFRDHSVFRLGDIVHRDLPQIWEILESQGLTVGAVSPMNAKNRLRKPAFFIPDPWTATAAVGDPLLRALYSAVCQAVNDNAQSRLTLKSVAAILAAFAHYVRPSDYAGLIALAMSARTCSWRKAIFLDRLLASVFLHEVKRTRVDFASLFLNAGAHIQHHYLFSSAAYDGPHRNPEWYIPSRADPVLDVYRSYDRILSAVQTHLPNARLMIATGLHQVPYPEITYYWRLREHEQFLAMIGLDFVKVEPRMSRDFLVICADDQAALNASARLRAAVSHDGAAMFEVDNRGRDLFVSLIYSREIGAGFTFRIHDRSYRGLEHQVAFVALKNGEHHGTGYFIDTGSSVTARAQPTRMLLSEIPSVIADALGARFPLRERPTYGADDALS